MRDTVFEFRIDGKLRIVITGDNEDRYARYCERIGVEPGSDGSKVDYASNQVADWELEKTPVEGCPTNGFKAKPVFYEAKYNAHFFIEDKSVTDCRVEHVMASVSDEFEYVPERYGMDGTLDFINSPGKFVLEVALFRGRNKEVVKIEWWVVSEKIDVCKDAGLIIGKIEEVNKGFVYSFLTKTKNSGGISNEKNAEDRIWHDIFKSFVDQYLAACRWVVNSPHLKYQNHARLMRADRIRKWTPGLVNRFCALPRYRQERASLRTEEICPELDTVENRFVKYTLKAIGERLGRFADKCRVLEQDGEGVSLAHIETMDDWKREIDQLSARPFFRSIGRFTGFKQESLALQRKRGYSKIQDAWIALQHAIDVTGKGIDVGNQPIWKLYEFWCFIVIRDILEEFKLTRKSESLGTINDIDDIYVEDRTEEEVEDEADVADGSADGSICKYVFEDNSSGHPREITLSYQQSYRAAKGRDTLANIVEQIPDIVLTIRDLDGEGKSYSYLFDAKYRIYSMPSRKNPRYDAAPFETLNDMHRYRDAILYRRQTDEKLSREIIGAYVLYPGRPDRSYDYEKVISEENIGAIPLLPRRYRVGADGKRVLDGEDGERHLREFLEKILNKGTKKAHLENAIPPRGAEISLEPIGEHVILAYTSKLLGDEAWLLANGYNIPFEKASGSLTPEMQKAEYLLLHDAVNPAAGKLYAIDKKRGISGMSKTEMTGTGYDNPSKAAYAMFHVANLAEGDRYYGRTFDLTKLREWTNHLYMRKPHTIRLDELNGLLLD